MSRWRVGQTTSVPNFVSMTETGVYRRAPSTPHLIILWSTLGVCTALMLGSWNGSVSTASVTQIQTMLSYGSAPPLACTAATGVVERMAMNLLAGLRRRRNQLDQWDAERILSGLKGARDTTWRQIRTGINMDIAHDIPPGWKQIRLSVTDRVWAFWLWLELSTQLMR